MSRRHRGTDGRERAATRAIGAVLALAALLVAAAPEAASAQRRPIDTDRPGLGFAPTTVAPVQLQLEMGAPEMTYTSFEGGEDFVFAFPMLGRLGVADGVEIRAGLSPLTVDVREGDVDAADRAEVGPGDLEVGVKWRFLEGTGSTPTFLLVPSATLPTGEAGVSRDRASFQGTLQASWQLASDVGANLFLGAGVDPENDDWAGTGIAGADVSFPLGDALRGYGEIGWLPDSGAPDDVLAGGGALWRLTPYAQIDAFLDVGLTAGSTDWIVGAGFARLF